MRVYLFPLLLCCMGTVFGTTSDEQAIHEEREALIQLAMRNELAGLASTTSDLQKQLYDIVEHTLCISRLRASLSMHDPEQFWVIAQKIHDRYDSDVTTSFTEVARGMSYVSIDSTLGHPALDIEQIEKATPSSHTEATRHLIHLLQKSIEYTEGSAAFLVPPPDHDYMDIYANFTRSFESLKTEARPWATHIPEFGALAAMLMRVQLSYTVKGCRDMGHNLHFVQHFASEILSRSQSGDTSYEWFLLFTHRFITYITHKNPFYNNTYYDFNTGFDRYQKDLRNRYFVMPDDPDTRAPVFLLQSKFQEAMKQASTAFTDQFVSTSAKVKEFPDVIYMPCPFDMTAAELFDSIPSTWNALGACMYARKGVYADGAFFPPDTGFVHDLQHYTNLAYCTRSVVMRLNPEFAEWGALLLAKDALQLAWSNMVHYRKEYVSYLQEAQNFLRQVPDEPADEKTMFTFFCFYMFHEGVWSTTDRVRMLQQSGELHKSLCAEEGLGLLQDPYYYQPLLPQGLHGLSDEDLRKRIDAYVIRFQEKFAAFAGAVDYKESTNTVSIPFQNTLEQQDTLLVKRQQMGPELLSYASPNDITDELLFREPTVSLSCVGIYGLHKTKLNSGPALAEAIFFVYNFEDPEPFTLDPHQDRPPCHVSVIFPPKLSNDVRTQVTDTLCQALE